MSTAQLLYERWITELWAGRQIAGEIVTDDFVGHWPDREVHGPAELEQIISQTRNMLADLNFHIEIGPICDGDLVAGRWAGAGVGPEGPLSFTGNDILRLGDGRQRFAEYWTGTSTG
ncbi:ester cyclase [Mycobacterium szulgai]|uniref:Polyketide cyclase n=1 Tax=Mycobacterium szulgai TaxID=1787 RepID=A0A1X2DX15_MYCSZ|nr:nuclear transport factor 2 family protein [Mycobacterium szulgai]MCV7075296.1 nuclear transport factor 2 family protein [Mycobacterium szulgai]ORW92737.1 polyketide cyclase [Mycobacterium szulgai]